MIKVNGVCKKEAIFMYDVNKVVDFFLHKGSMSPKKLQKLLYYAYAWTLALLNENIDDTNFKLFNDKIEAWIHGPVVPSVYHKYKSYGWNEIPQNQNFDDCTFTPQVLDVLNQVWDVYGNLSGNQLESISHQEMPWQHARVGYAPSESCNKQISDRDIFEYYNEQAQQ